MVVQGNWINELIEMGWLEKIVGLSLLKDVLSGK